MAKNRDHLPTLSTRSDVDAFLAKVRTTSKPLVGGAGMDSGRRARLLFAMDATASREPAWDAACHIQNDMFTQTAALGALDIQLCYYRGFRDFHTSPWLSTGEQLRREMSAVSCVGGMTQLHRVLRHALQQTGVGKINAAVFVGDAVEEDVDVLCHEAGRLGVLGVPVFVFHEGADTCAGAAFKQIARLSGGAYCRFDGNSAQQLRALLNAVAVYAVGGRKALENFSTRQGGPVRQLGHQLKR